MIYLFQLILLSTKKAEMLVLEPEALGSNPASFYQIESAGDEKLEKVKRITTMGTLAAG